MKSYYVLFFDGVNKVCGTWKKANNKEEACVLAEFAIMCHYPNVKYSSCKVINKA